jgi:hypothetical protein
LNADAIVTARSLAGALDDWSLQAAAASEPTVIAAIMILFITDILFGFATQDTLRE